MPLSLLTASPITHFTRLRLHYTCRGRLNLKKNTSLGMPTQRTAVTRDQTLNAKAKLARQTATLKGAALTFFVQ